MIEKLKEHKKTFIEECCIKKVPYEPRGILNIESFYWWSLVGHYKPDIILESGVFLGRSTDILARAQKFFNIPMHYAFDKSDEHAKHVRKKLKPFSTIYKITDSFSGFREVLDANPGKKVLSIIDGPKGEKPLSRLIELLSRYNCCALASHDCMPSSKIPSVFISSCKKHFPNGEVIITSPSNNVDLSNLNTYIMSDMTSYYTQSEGRQSKEKIAELLDRSNYVGICFGTNK